MRGKTSFSSFWFLGLDSQKFLQPFILKNKDSIQVNLAPSTLQFAKAYLTFSRDLFKIHYPLVIQTMAEALVELIKLHLKYYERALQKLQSTNEKPLKIFIMKNVEIKRNGISVEDILCSSNRTQYHSRN